MGAYYAPSLSRNHLRGFPTWPGGVDPALKGQRGAVPRQLLVKSDQGSQVLGESLAHNEAQLQTVMRDHPGLLPLEDFDLVGPPLVVGKETGVPSGCIDLVLLARGGELVLVEFKTGPQNPDFRSALAQVLDYGSDLWQMSLDDFERRVALRFFASTQAQGTGYERCKSLDAAIDIAWAGNPLSEEERVTFKDRLATDLADGAFTYVVAAQRLTDAMSTTARYLNVNHRRSRFFLIEMVRFIDKPDGAEEVFEARTVLRPDPTARSSPRGARGTRLTRESLMELIDDQRYAETVQRLLDAAETAGLTIWWGTSGLSLRLPNSRGGPPASVGWFFPPAVAGWLGLSDLVLGYDPASPAFGPLEESLVAFMSRVALVGGSPQHNGGLVAQHFPPDMIISHISELIDALDLLTGQQGD